jgi:glycosyltransferase involved in cell wall biosynthesis
LPAVTLGRISLRAWLSARLILERFQGPPDLRRAVRRVDPEPSGDATIDTRQLLIDVSVLAHHDAGSGIQRVTKALLGELAKSPPEGYVVRTVRASRWCNYRYIDEWGSSRKVQVCPGDIFLGLDLASRILPRHRLQLLEWRARGAWLCFVMYDLLPLLHPDWFTRRNSRAHAAWLRTVAVHADSVACISQSVAGQFQTWLGGQGFDRESAPKIGWFHLGVQRPSLTGPAPPDIRVAQIAEHPYILSVGTIEPRKGYAMVLDAFEEIWRNGHKMHLVIVGRIGWKVEALVERLRIHAQARDRLHWFDDADDPTLDALYKAASGVLVASEAEGFGLPVLEAAAHSKPLLIRDLPVFREIAGDGATFFRAAVPAQFVEDLQNWLTRLAGGTATSSQSITLRTWAQSAGQMLHHALPADRSTF